MKNVLLSLLLFTSPALAQTQLVPRDTIKPAAKSAAARAADVCAPIGKTAKGTGLFDEMRQHTGAACSAAPGRGGSRRGAAAGAGGPKERRVRLVL